MNHIKLGVRLESLNLPFRKALTEASRLGVSGVQIDAVGDFAPDTLSQSGRRELTTLLRSYNVQLTALGCPLRRGLDAAEDQDRRLEQIRKVMTLAFDLGPRITILAAGAVPEGKGKGEGEETPESRRYRESLANLAAHGDRSGTSLALETGLESGSVLAAYLGSFDTGSLGVNYDPANLLLNRLDLVASLEALRGRVLHAHARDGRKGNASRAAREVPVGSGDIDWLALLEQFENVEYRGWLVVEREEGENRLADVSSGVQFLQRLLGVGG